MEYPLTSDDNGNLIATITSDITNHPLINYRYSSSTLHPVLNVSIRNISVETSMAAYSLPVRFTSGCGEPINVPYAGDVVSVPEIMTSFVDSRIFSRNGFNVTITEPAVTAAASDGQPRILLLDVRHLRVTRTLRVNGVDRASVTLNTPTIYKELQQITCHNSGGG